MKAHGKYGKGENKLLIIAGIIPEDDFPLTSGWLSTEDGQLVIGGRRIKGGQGTAAMARAALAVTSYLNDDSPYAVFAGDIGSGEGSRAIYRHLIQYLHDKDPGVIVLHYWMPDMELIAEFGQVVAEKEIKPIMVADAGSMYAAKAAGLSCRFDLFTPDMSELAFLADPDALHPAYINRHLFEFDDSRQVELVKRAYEVGGASRVLLVKGKTDLVADQSGVLAEIDQPDIPALECVGGTGDTITGMCAAFLAHGMEVEKAAYAALVLNRWAGKLAEVTPATRIEQIIDMIPEALMHCDQVLK